MNTLPLKKFSVLLFLFIAAFTPSCYTQQPVEQLPSPTQTVSIVNEQKLEADILDYINQYRVSKGLNELKSEPVIAEQAAQHSANMASKKVAFSHDGFENRIQVISGKLGVMSASAENVALGKLTAKQVVDVWLKSPGHRKNIEGKYQLTGIGTAVDGQGTVFFTQIFTRK